jgi:NADPH:quinone reductase-like Zn-dependent oxidoreductase
MRQIQTRTDIEGFEVRDVNIRKALVVPINQTVETRLQLAPWRSSPIANDDDSYWTEFKVSSRNESGTWTANCTGLIKAFYTPKGDSTIENGVFVNEEAVANAQLQTEYKEIRQGDFPSLEPAVFYDKLDSLGFHLGPAFQGVKKLNLLNNKSHYTMEVEDTKQYYPAKWESPHLIHPSVLDVFIHLLTSSAGYSEGLTARMPVSTASLYVSAKFNSTPGTKYHGFSRTRKVSGGGDKMASDVFAFGEDGDDKPVIALRGCEHVPLRGSGAQSDASAGSTTASLGGHVPIVPRLALDVTMVDAAQIQQILQDGPNLATSLSKYLPLFAHKYPALDILEANSSADSLLTQALLGAGGEIHKRVKSVVLSGAVAPEEQSGPWKQLIHHQQLNLSEDPVAQGFEEASRDLIVLDTALKYEGDNAVVLANIKKLLKPWGVLLVANGSSNTSVIPDSVLVSAGFTVPTTINASDASRLSIAYVTKQSNTAVQNILIITPPSPSSKVSRAVEQVERELQQARNYNITKLPFNAAIPEQLSAYLALFALDLDLPFLEDLDENSFAKLRSLILGTQGSLWLTLDTESKGLITGLGRTIRAEYPEIPFTTLSLDSAAPFDAEVNVRTIARLIASRKPLDQSTDSEYVIRKGQVLVERLEPEADLKTLLDAAQSGQSLPAVTMPLKDRGDQTLRLLFREPGSLGSFEYHPVPGLTAVDPVAEGQMEIEVRSVGLNSHDVMMAMGQLEGTNIGMECAGIVLRLGPGVTKFRVGDRVFGLHSGCFQTRVRVDPRTFTHTPEYISDELAGSLMGQYQTAVHSLINVGRLQRDESVLIHSAAGGVGQAAIIVAQYLGSKKIFCTVSSDKKKKFLMAEYGIPEAHIFNSRDHSFADGIMRLTNGKGVDVVLNSLSNEALRRTWNCVAPFGRFIELGKRDIYDNTGLEMRPFLNNITFSGLDISALITEYPDKCEKLGSQVLELLEQGVIRPLKNVTQYSFGQVEQAFQLMQSGNNIGKVVLIPRSDDIVPVIPGGLGAFRLSSNSTYVLVGGLGGLGRSIAKMLADKGAKHFVFLSRSGSTRPESQALLDELQVQGVSSTVTAVDVADKAQLEAALNKVKKSCPPIKGLIHCAMDLKVGPLSPPFP